VLRDTGHAYLDRAPIVVGICFALVAVGLCLRVGGGLPGVPSRWPFALAPPLAFFVQEQAERLIAFGGVHASALVEPAVLAGLLVQLPLALVAYLLARALLACADAVSAALATPGPRRAARAPVPGRPSAARVRRPSVLAAGEAGRAPPPAPAK
jgi:hypothetical protein